MSRWTCKACPKTFGRKGDLTRHELIHTGTKPYVCERCGKAFRQHSALKTHRNVHTGNTPHICGIGTCKKAFGDPSSCSRHRKETHSPEGTYKCVVPECGTRIKRRSTFAAHLRKHGLDATPNDLNAMFLQNKQSEISSLAQPGASPGEEDKSYNQVELQNVSLPSLVDGSEYSTSASGNGDMASHFADNLGRSGDDPFDCRRANCHSANDPLLLGPMIDQTVNAGPSGYPHDIYAYSSSNFEDPFYFDGILSTVGYPLLVDSHWNFPTFDPPLEAGSVGSQSSWSSPSSTFSVQSTTGSNDDVASLSLADNGLQESLLCSLL